MDKIHCSICNKKHTVYLNVKEQSIASILQISSSELEKRVVSHEDFFYLVDKKKVWVKANLSIKIKQTDHFMNWLVWAELSLDDFFDVSENYREKVGAKLLSDLFYYQNKDQVRITLQFDFTGEIKYPNVVHIHDEGELKEDFFNGITMSKVAAWIEQLHHYDDT